MADAFCVVRNTSRETHGSFQTMQRSSDRLSASPVAKLKVTAGPLTLGRRGRKWQSRVPQRSEHDRGSGYVWNHYANAMDTPGARKEGAVRDHVAEPPSPARPPPAPASAYERGGGSERD
eukprot:5539671-Prymnesium_polylepis.2